MRWLEQNVHISMKVHSTSPLEICVEQRQSSSQRLILAAFICAMIILAVAAQIFLPAPYGTVGVFCFCVALVWAVFKTALSDDVRWTIRFGEILIERDSIFGRRRAETIGIGEITDISLQKYDDEEERCFRLDVRLQSARHLLSPPIVTEADARAVEAGIRTWLQVGMDA